MPELSSMEKAGDWTILTKRVRWYGAATGYYSMLPAALAAAGIATELVAPEPGWLVRLRGKFWSWRHRLPARNQSIAFAEWQFVRRFERAQAPGLVLALEDHLPLLSLPQFRDRAPRRLVGVIHFPRSCWTEPMLASLSRLRSALVLYRADIPFFETFVGRGRVKYVCHGVDARHFTPGRGNADGRPQLLVSGQFRRDFALLAEVFPRVRESFPDARLSIVGAHEARFDSELRRLSAMPGVTVHGFCSDTELLAHYRRATLLVLPLTASGANNALVEALACGVPVVATDIGGVRDYGGGTIFPVTPPADIGAMTHTIRELLRDAARRRQLGAAARQFAVENLSWERSAAQHREALDLLLAPEHEPAGR